MILGGPFQLRIFSDSVVAERLSFLLTLLRRGMAVLLPHPPLFFFFFPLLFSLDDGDSKCFSQMSM